MPRVYIKELGRYAVFPDTMSSDDIEKEIKKYLSQGKDDGIEVGKALSSGWRGGWRDARDAAADYADLVGLDEQAAKLRAGISADEQQEEFVPEGFVEKLLTGIGSAPGALVGMTPALAAAAGTTVATANPILGAAAGFGLHGAVRGGDGNVLSPGALKEGIIGAAEGAAFGGLGKIAGLGRLGHAAGSAGIGTASGAARTLAEGETPTTEDMASQAAVMGLLGLAFGGGKKGEVAGVPAAEEQAIAAGSKPKAARLPKNINDVLMKQAEELGLEGWKPPDIPFNISFFTPKQQFQIAEKIKSGEFKLPDTVGYKEIAAIADRMNPELGRKLVLSNYEQFSKAYGEGKLAAQDLNALKVFRESLDENRDVMEQLQSARSSGDVEMTAALEARKAELASELMEIAGIYQGYGTEVGRTLSARNAHKIGLPLKEQAILSLKKKNLLDQEAIDRIMSATTPEEIRAITKTAWEPKLSDKLHEGWLMGLLSSPLTWGPTGVNAISNLAKNTILRYPVKTVQAGVEKIRAAAQGRKAEYTFRDVADEMMLDITSAPAVFKQFLYDTVHEKPFDSGKLELNRGAAIGGGPNASVAEKALGYVTRTPGRFLEAADAAFRSQAEAREAFKIASDRLGRKASWADRKDLAREMIDDPQSYIKEFIRIKNAGDEAVFTHSLSQRADYIAIAKIANVAQGMKASKNPLIKWLARGLFPFTRTPANIAIDALQHSPFGIREYYRLRKVLNEQKSGEFTGAPVLQRDLSEQIAKTVVGTSLMGWMAYEALQGNVTGGGPVDYPDYQKWIEAGNQPYSFKIGDKWVSYQRIEPFASIMGMAADAVETGLAPDDERLDRAFSAVKDNIANKTFLLGLENLSKAWANPKRYGTTFAQSLAATAIPSAVGFVARGEDPYIRMTTGDTAGQSVVNALKNRIPGARETLEPRYSVTGHPLIDEYSMVNALSPFRMAPTKASIVDKEISRLAQLGYDTPNLQRRNRNVKGRQKQERVTTEEYATFHQYNAKAAEALERIMSTPNWQKLNPKAQSDIIMSIYQKYGRVSSSIVRNQMSRRLPPQVPVRPY